MAIGMRMEMGIGRGMGANDGVGMGGNCGDGMDLDVVVCGRRDIQFLQAVQL